ncbi:MAG TPA: amidohydrolase [Actinomycetota bacterium]
MPDPAGVQADLAFLGGGVYTVDTTSRWAEAVAVREGRIVAVGPDARIRERIGPSTRTVDLRGRMLLPGFQDAHVHAIGAGMDRLTVDLSPAHDIAGYAERIRAYAHAHPEVEWIRGGGWSMDVFPGGTPTRETLDEIVADRPVFLSNRDNHAAWVNSRALDLAGVDRRTVDPTDGRVERLADGSPQGTLHEGAMLLVRRHVPDPGVDQLLDALMDAQAYLHALGITAWQEAIVGAYPTMPDATDAYPALEAAGRLTARVTGALWWRRDRGPEQIADLVETRARTTGARYRPTTVKIMVDGIVENRTAAMVDPYSDGGGNGLAYVERSTLIEAVARLDEEGFDVHLHAIGDRAVRDALDAVAQARDSNGHRGRHHVAHLQVVDPRDTRRFARAGVTANLQMLWAADDAAMATLTVPALGPERSTWQYPFGSLAASGATLCAGSDWPVSTPDVLQQIFVGVERVSPAGYPYGGGTEPFLPHERITLPQALRAFTMGSAYVNRLETLTGSIEVGKAADLVVLSANVFEPGGLAAARPLLTVVDGSPVFEDPTL